MPFPSRALFNIWTWRKGLECMNASRYDCRMGQRKRHSLFFLAALLTVAAHADRGWAQSDIPRVGMLVIASEKADRDYAPHFYAKLNELGWVEGKNISYVYVGSSTRYDPSLLPEAAAELISLDVDVIYAESAPAVRAAYAATRTIPIVGTDYTNDPVEIGYAKNYRQPGGNITGVFLDAPKFAGKWVELLKSIVPDLTRAVVLYDPSPGETHLRALEAVANKARIQLQVMEVHKPGDIDRVATSTFSGRPQVIFIIPSPMMYRESPRLAHLAAEQRLPAISMDSRFAVHGGLLAYGPQTKWSQERTAGLVSRILKGAKVGDLPIERPDKLELVVNLRTAKSLGLAIPEEVLLRADRVIK